MSVELLSPVWTHLTQVQPARAEGIYIYDSNDNKYIDFTSGIGVTNTGHCHPKVVKAVQEQAASMIFSQMNITIHPKAIELAEKLNGVTPEKMNRFFFSNSGAEAVEASVKLARQATGRKNIVVMQGSFHGRTHQTMAMTTSKYIYRKNYQPLPGGVFVTPFPYAYYYGWDEEEATEFCMKQLDLLLQSQTSPEETAAIVIEPILGEGGYVPAPDGFLQELRAVCDQHGILLIADEVQSGFGRTGKFFAYEHAGIEPDIIIMAKGLGSGLPISAISAPADLMDKWIPGTHGGTYGGGSPISLAGAVASIEAILEDGLVENAKKMGAYLVTRLKEMQRNHPGSNIGDVRGRGLMVGVEFTDRDGNPDADMATEILNACLEKNLLLLICGSYKNVIRWIPPLVVTKDQIDDALEIFETAFSTLESK
ncbi:MAG: aminotransferase class III-fold pyridoxal phosphate-dependent enzyme [Chloroflexota bacterium]